MDASNPPPVLAQVGVIVLALGVLSGIVFYARLPPRSAAPSQPEVVPVAPPIAPTRAMDSRVAPDAVAQPSAWERPAPTVAERHRRRHRR